MLPQSSFRTTAPGKGFPEASLRALGGLGTEGAEFLYGFSKAVRGVHERSEKERGNIKLLPHSVPQGWFDIMMNERLQ